MPALSTSLAARGKFRERNVVNLILGGVAFPDGASVPIGRDGIGRIKNAGSPEFDHTSLNENAK
jgi:hypothetical protein